MMPMNTRAPRIHEHRKLSIKPKWLTTNKLTRSIFRARAYDYNKLPKIVTQQTEIRKFKKELKKYLKTKHMRNEKSSYFKSSSKSSSESYSTSSSKSSSNKIWGVRGKGVRGRGRTTSG